MLNTKKRNEWRTKKEILEQWPKKQDLIEDMREEIANLRDEIQKQKETIIQSEKNTKILGDLYDNGIIDNDGSLL